MKKTFFCENTSNIVGNLYVHYTRFASYLFIFWLLISGEINAKFIIIGILTSFIVSWVCMPLLLIYNTKGTRRYFALAVPPVRFFIYMLWLLKELTLSNIDVARTAWKKEMPLEPEIIKFRIDLDNPIAVTLLSNSITLTPGTTNLNITSDNVYSVHALTVTAAEGIRSGAMAEKVARLFHEKAEFIYLEEDKS